jgi:signal transduction histidine kinase
MFCCLFRKREQNYDFNIEQINVLISIDRESERTRRSSEYHTSSVYLKDTSLFRQFSDVDEYIVYEVLHTIIDNIIDKSGIK